MWCTVHTRVLKWNVNYLKYKCDNTVWNTNYFTNYIANGMYSPFCKLNTQMCQIWWQHLYFLNHTEGHASNSLLSKHLLWFYLPTVIKDYNFYYETIDLLPKYVYLIFHDHDLLFVGAFLPPPQPELETKYKQELWDTFGIEFNQLFTITNMPIKRFCDFLYRRSVLVHT